MGNVLRGPHLSFDFEILQSDERAMKALLHFLKGIKTFPGGKNKFRAMRLMLPKVPLHYNPDDKQWNVIVDGISLILSTSPYLKQVTISRCILHDSHRLSDMTIRMMGQWISAVAANVSITKLKLQIPLNNIVSEIIQDILLSTDNGRPKIFEELTIFGGSMRSKWDFLAHASGVKSLVLMSLSLDPNITGPLCELLEHPESRLTSLEISTSNFFSMETEDVTNSLLIPLLESLQKRRPENTMIEHLTLDVFGGLTTIYAIQHCIYQLAKRLPTIKTVASIQFVGLSVGHHGSMLWKGLRKNQWLQNITGLEDCSSEFQRCLLFLRKRNKLFRAMRSPCYPFISKPGLLEYIATWTTRYPDKNDLTDLSMVFFALQNNPFLFEKERTNTSRQPPQHVSAPYYPVDLIARTLLYENQSYKALFKPRSKRYGRKKKLCQA